MLEKYSNWSKIKQDNDAGGAAVQEDAAHQVRGVRSSEVNMEARRDCREDSGVASKLEDDYSCCWPGRSAPWGREGGAAWARPPARCWGSGCSPGTAPPSRGWPPAAPATPATRPPCCCHPPPIKIKPASAKFNEHVRHVGNVWRGSSLGQCSHGTIQYPFLPNQICFKTSSLLLTHISKQLMNHSSCSI